MASKLTKRQELSLRDRLAKQATMIAKRLMENSLGELEDTIEVSRDDEGNRIMETIKVEMTAGQIKSAEIILKKCMPDLQSIDSTTVLVNQRSGAEVREEAKLFLMSAGLTDEAAEVALKKMAKDAIH